MRAGSRRTRPGDRDHRPSPHRSLARPRWDSAIVVAAFTPLGAATFLPDSLALFRDGTTDLADVLTDASEIRRLPERLAETGDHAARIALVERFLIARIRKDAPDPVDAIVAEAVAHIESSRGTVRISDLAGRVGLDQSALERRFRRRIGTSPRRFASLIRLQSVLRLAAQGHSLTQIAYAAGYYDLAHFHGDFFRLAGQGPGAYFGRARTG